MPLTTNFNQSPYFDDYNANSNYHRILFKPGQAIQARELTQMQTILQNQVERFGDNIFVEGTVIQGCNFSYNPNYQYVKLPDLMVNGAPVNPAAYIGWTAVDSTSNLQAIVLNSSAGYLSQAVGNGAVNTIYVKYVNSGNNGAQVFANSATLKFYAGTYQYGNTANYQSFYDTNLAGYPNGTLSGSSIYPTGSSYVFSVGDGVIFQKGAFIRVANTLSVIVSQYNNQPSNVSVGFVTQENIITYLQDPTLLDNASGFTNQNAPGADRLQLIPTLYVANIGALPSNNFLTLVQWQNGQPTQVNQTTQYNVLESELARREYETSGNFFVQPFGLATEQNPFVPGYFNMIVGSGLGYIDGYRVQQLNPSRYLVRQGNDTRTLANQSISMAYGNFLNVQEFVGTFPIGQKVYFYDTAARAVSTDSFLPNPVGNVIGSATLLSLDYGSGVVDSNSAIYELYLTNIQMNSGKSFFNAKSIYANTGASNTGLADIILQWNSTLNANVAYLQDSNFSTLIFPSGASSTSTLQAGTTPSFTFRTSNTGVQFNSSGVATVVQTAYSYPYGSGNLTTIQKGYIIVVPVNTANVGNSTTYSGTVTTTSGSNTVTGTGTAFQTQLQVNDYLNVLGTVRRITNIANNTLLYTDGTTFVNATTNTYNKCYPANIPINFNARNSTIGISANTMTLSLLNSVGAPEVFPNGGPNTTIFYDLSTSVNAKQKYVNTAIVYIDTALNAPLTGTITTTSGSAVVTGVGTFFTNTLSAGYSLYLANNSSTGALIGTIASIANNTSLTLSANATGVYAANVITYSAPNSSGPGGPWSLGLPDAIRLQNVYRISNSNTYTNSAIYDVTSQFAINKNQTDGLYNLSQLMLTAGSNIQLNNGDKLTVVFQVFTESTTAPGFFSVDSYPKDDSKLANTTANTTASIPLYTSSSGATFALRDSIDFRPYMANTVSITSTFSNTGTGYINPISSSSIVGSGFITPNQTFTYNVTYYLPRIDKLVLNGSGVFSIVEGISSESPAAPPDQSTAATIATIMIPPYPTLLPIQGSINGLSTVAYISSQNRRYTMADIGALNTRITNLEYYSSLNLLETSTNNLVINNSNTGLNAFKNGIFVDNFESYAAANPNDPEYAVGRNWAEASIVPMFQQYNIDLQYASGSGVAVSGDLVTLAWTANVTEVQLFSQQHATRIRNCTAGVYDWVGTMATAPVYDNFMDVRVQPIVQNVLNNTYNTYNSTTNITNNMSTITNVVNNTTNITNNTTNNITNNNNTNQIIEAAPAQTTAAPNTSVTSTGTVTVNIPTTTTTIPAVIVSNTAVTNTAVNVPTDIFQAANVAIQIDALDTAVTIPSIQTTSPAVSPAPVSLGGAVGGGGGCVALESYVLMDEDFLPHGYPVTQAYQVEAGHMIITYDLETQENKSINVKYAANEVEVCYRIITAKAMLVCSESAPIPTRDHGVVKAPNLLGKYVLVNINGEIYYDEVIGVYNVGKKFVRPIDAHNSCFWAGELQGQYILHHNILLSVSDGIGKLNKE